MTEVESVVDATLHTTNLTLFIWHTSPESICWIFELSIIIKDLEHIS